MLSLLAQHRRQDRTVSRANADALKLAERKRGGESLTDREIESLISGYTAGEIDDDAMTQWLRAVCDARA